MVGLDVTLIAEGTKSPSKWRERLENGLRGVGICADIFCPDCPFVSSEGFCIRASMEENEYPWLYRHLLITVKDWGDAEIRARIAEMLDPELREKFLGKAEPTGYKVRLIDEPYTRLPGGDSPDLGYAIETGRPGTEYDAANIAAAFRDEETRDFCLEKLNERK